MDDNYVDEWGGFSMAKVLLSDVLPRSVYDPCKEKTFGGRSDQARRRDKDIH